jgi:hypothetical protein
MIPMLFEAFPDIRATLRVVGSRKTERVPDCIWNLLNNLSDRGVWAAGLPSAQDLLGQPILALQPEGKAFQPAA